MTKSFNEVLPLNDIIKAYKTGQFPNTFCLLWNGEQNVELIANESGDYIFTQTEEGGG